MEPVLVQNAIKIDAENGSKTGTLLERFWVRFGCILGGLKVEIHALAAAGLVFSKDPFVVPTAPQCASRAKSDLTQAAIHAQTSQSPP